MIPKVEADGQISNSYHAIVNDDITQPIEWKEGELIIQLTSLPNGLAYIMINCA
jgi:hypothetical protein